MLGYGHYLALRSGVTLAIRRTLANYPSTLTGSFESLYTTSQANYPEVSFWEWHRVYVKSHPEAIGVL